MDSKSLDSLIALNGIDATTGTYASALSANQIAQLAAGTPMDQDHEADLQHAHQEHVTPTFAPIAGVDPKDLSKTGWGVIFPVGQGSEIRAALKPLLDLRKQQARDCYKEFQFLHGAEPETKRNFLARHGVAAGNHVDPAAGVPYYLLIVADPETIPYAFQYQIDVEYAVGRIWFEQNGVPDVAAFARYASSVVHAETTRLALPRAASFFAVANENDAATNLALTNLVEPLIKHVNEKHAGWGVESFLGDAARKDALDKLINRRAPALLFTSSHGVAFPENHERQLSDQGGLLCQDWGGPYKSKGPLVRDQYFAAHDVSKDANLLGSLSFHFACYSTGTPRLDDFPHLRQLTEQKSIAKRAFLAGLPQRMLGHENGGALATVGHVERAWSMSFDGGLKLGEQTQTFRSTMTRLLDGMPIGAAMEDFNQRYAALAAELSDMLQQQRFGKKLKPWDLAALWTSSNDARSYLIIGDPAVRLAVAADGSVNAENRVIEAVTVPAPVVSQPLPSGVSASVAPASKPANTLTITIQVSMNESGVSAAVVSDKAGHPLPADSSTASDLSFGLPTTEDAYDDREGYDPDFLGENEQSVPLPRLSPSQLADAVELAGADPGENRHELRYHHFSLVMSRSRKLACLTAVNIDGRITHQPRRPKDRWVFDPRLPREYQLGDELYGRPFDRGHLVRRLDPAWGRTAKVAQLAIDDTFHWTNCSPQHMAFNGRKKMWAGLEDFLLAKASGPRRRLTVFTGPIFAANDPEYRGVLVPQQFWKVAVVQRPDAQLAVMGFKISQEHLLRSFLSFGPEEVATLYQVSLGEIEHLTGLSFGALTAIQASAPQSFDPTGGGALEELEDILLPF